MLRRFLPRFRLVACALVLFWATSPAAATPSGTEIGALEFNPGHLAFSVDTGGFVTNYSANPLFVLPGEVVPLEIAGAPTQAFHAEATGGALTEEGPSHWRWQAPHGKGAYRIEIRGAKSPAPMVFNAFVLVPFEDLKGESLNGYRIGQYPEKPLNLLPTYRPPRGFIEVTPENEAIPLSPHFTLGQFLCKQPGEYPKYIVLQERLIYKLEVLLEKLNDRGHYARTLHVMSGYRTPFYNHAIGNVRYSRHTFGDAADVFADEDGNGQMDDLNRDGKSDRRDAEVFSALVEELEQAPLTASLAGGLAIYKRNAAHGPFVHVDARGTAARWTP